MLKPKRVIFTSVFVLLILVLCIQGSGQQNNGLRTIEFETSEVTKAEVALSPDNSWLVFTMLGHLFRLPIEGGTAEQLTFGPCYDSQPAISPDGNYVAFVSDRDGSEGNVFVMELASGDIRQVTYETKTGRPAWTPNGQKIVYLQMSAYWDSTRDGRARFNSRAIVRRISLEGGEPETLCDQRRDIRSVFFLPDGRMAWNVVDEPSWVTQIEVMNPGGTTSTLRKLEGESYLVVPSPNGEGLVCNIRGKRGIIYDSLEELLFVPLPDGDTRQVSYLQRQVERRPWLNTGFALSSDSEFLYIGDTGRLWKVALTNGSRDLINFRASVKLEIQNPIQPPKWRPPTPGSSASPRSILDPIISADGQTLVFRAAGSFWLQSLEQSSETVDMRQAEQLFEDDADIWDLSFSPDGQYLVYLREDFRKDELIEERRLYNLKSRKMRTLAFGDFWRGHSWSADGQRLIYVDLDEKMKHSVVALNVRDGTKKKIADHINRMRFVQLSPDGRWLYYNLGRDLFRLSLEEKAEPEQITRMTGFMRYASLSPDCRWLALNHNRQIWIAEFNGKLLEDKDFWKMNSSAGETFSFTPNSSALIYSEGNRIWKHSLKDGKREEIPIHLKLQRPIPVPMLLKNVRLLDFTKEGFGQKTSLFIDKGKIQWIGTGQGRRLPSGTVTVDGGDRFAIPGLFDMHMHSGGLPHEAFIAYGVTSVRDVGSNLAEICSRADKEESTSNPMPRYFYAGDIFRGVNDGYPQILNEEDVINNVQQRKEHDAHFIKLYQSVPWPLQRVAAEEARRLGMPIARHITTVEEVIKSVTLGFASLEHNRYVNRLYDDVFQMLALAGTRWIPTLMLTGGQYLFFRDEPEHIYDSKLMAFTPEWKRQLIKTRPVISRWKMPIVYFHGFTSLKLTGIQKAYNRGVKIHAGTDAPVNWLYYGWSLHWELDYFAKAGMKPLDVLQIATQKAAEAVGADDDIGTLEPGKLADIVLLDKNPLEDIKNTQSIWRVIKGGWVFDPEELKPDKSSDIKK